MLARFEANRMLSEMYAELAPVVENVVKKSHSLSQLVSDNLVHNNLSILLPAECRNLSYCYK